MRLLALRLSRILRGHAAHEGTNQVTHDEHRAKCIEAMELAYADRVTKGNWQFRDLMIAVFDALHNVARVNPIEATNKMVEAGSEKCGPEYGWIGSISIWNAMSAAGDLTNPPEDK
jgi:hypothetical protein